MLSVSTAKSDTNDRSSTRGESELFPHLVQAPIVEAVIHWQALAQRWPAMEELRHDLARRSPEYVKVRPQHEFRHHVELNHPGGPDREQSSSSVTWQGFRLTSNDERYVIQFLRGGVVFSRLDPYPDWARFEAAAWPFWEAFVTLCAPAGVQRIGVRFVNRIAVLKGRKPSDFLANMPKPPKGSSLQLESFLYQERYRVPETAYTVNVVRTQQPSSGSHDEPNAVILDIDVSIEQPIDLDPEPMHARLAEMRQLKNEVFFRSITLKAVREFQGTSA
jgi:uncharacterized protein (TIGR04255 family)